MDDIEKIYLNFSVILRCTNIGANDEAQKNIKGWKNEGAQILMATR